MPVTRIAAAQRYAEIAAGSAAGSTSTSLPVPTADYVYAVAAIGWVGGVDISSDVFNITLGGVGGTPLFATPLHFDSNKSMLWGLIFADPDPATLAATYSSVATELLNRNLFLVAGVWSQVTPLDLGSISDNVVTAVGSGSVTSSGITVPSLNPANRVISAHMVGAGRKVTGFNKTRVASSAGLWGGQVILGEARGASSVTSTITHDATTSKWAAFGLNLGPTPVACGMSDTVKLNPSQTFGGGLYRIATPHPDREWIIPPVGSANPLDLAGNFSISADGVAMPVWEKDIDDTLEYTLYWPNHIVDDDEIVAVEYTTSGSLRVVAQAFEGVMTQVWLSNAAAHVQHLVRVRISTRHGRRHDRTFYITGVNN